MLKNVNFYLPSPAIEALSAQYVGVSFALGLYLFGVVHLVRVVKLRYLILEKGIVVA